MKRLSFSTRITVWSAILVAGGIVLCGLVSTLYVLRQERNELDGDLRDDGPIARDRVEQGAAPAVGGANIGSVSVAELVERLRQALL